MPHKQFSLVDFVEHTQDKTDTRSGYDHWIAKSKPCCRGACLCPGYPVKLLLTASLIFGIILLYACLIIVDTVFSTLWAVALVIHVILSALTITFLFLTALTDPGILPPEPEETDFMKEVCAKSIMSNNISITIQDKTTPEVIHDDYIIIPAILNDDDMIVGPEIAGKNNRPKAETQSTYCTTCHAFRPLRSSHCRQCNACILRFDHHCTWLGCDVGLRNYRTYVIFISCLLSLIYFLIISSVTEIVMNALSITKTEYVRQAVIIALDVVVLAVSIFGAVYTTKLVVFHIKLIITNRTTKEKLVLGYRFRNHLYDFHSRKQNKAQLLGYNDIPKWGRWGGHGLSEWNSKIIRGRIRREAYERAKLFFPNRYKTWEGRHNRDKGISIGKVCAMDANSGSEPEWSEGLVGNCTRVTHKTLDNNKVNGIVNVDIKQPQVLASQLSPLVPSEKVEKVFKLEPSRPAPGLVQSPLTPEEDVIVITT